MFKNVGCEIKNWAKFIVVLLTIPAVLSGIGVWVTLMEYNLGFLGFIVGIVVSVIGYFLARLGAISLYAYGELVDCASLINENLKEHVERYSRRQVSSEEKIPEKLPTWKRLEMEREAKQATEKKDS